MTKVLIVGAGIAGSTAAWWLGRDGAEVTVVEHAAGQRSSGTPVDVRGPASAVVERMGIVPALREAATTATRLVVVDAAGRPIAGMPAQSEGGVELPRADLARVLATAAQEHAAFRYGATVTALAGDAAGVDVTFAHAEPERFDLVVGADGLHSRVRALAFGPEERFARPLGMAVATVALDEQAADPSSVLMYNVPGRALAIHPATGRSLAALMFRTPYAPAADPIGLVEAAYAGLGWRVPEVLARAREDLWCDSVSRVRLPAWSRGRITLVGDAASCVSFLGEGSSLAIAGAATLGAALAAHPVPEALRAYEHAHRRRATARQRVSGPMSHLLVPATAPGIAVRNAAMRLLPAS